MKLDHWKGFADFVWMEKLAGGPSANIVVMAKVAELLDLDALDLSWLCACYCAIYNAPAATAMYHAFKLDYVLEARHTQLVADLKYYEKGLPVHSNRLRTFGGAERMAKGMKELAKWVAFNDDQHEDYPDYDTLWDELTAIPGVGRYFAIKLAGIMHRVGLTTVSQYDIRAKGAKNGRQTLAYLFPGRANELILKAGNKQETIDLVNWHANEVYEFLTRRTTFGTEITWFELEAMLCEYNQAVKGHRYPGKTSDADLGQLYKVYDFFGPVDFVDTVFRARAATHPRYALGEESGWSGKRKEMLSIYKDLGYMWSDALYKYHDSNGDFTNPLDRAHTLDADPLTRPPGEDNGKG